MAEAVHEGKGEHRCRSSSKHIIINTPPCILEVRLSEAIWWMGHQWALDCCQCHVMFRVGQVDFNDAGRQVAKAPSISSHEFSSHERSGTVKFVVREVGRRVCAWYSRPAQPSSLPRLCRRAKVILRMFGARKACYKCGNGVSVPLSIIRV